MERLPWKRKYLGASIGHLTPLETYHHLLQKASGEANGDFPTYKFRSIDS